VVRAAVFSGKWLSNHVPGAMDANATIEERCFLCDPCRDVIRNEQSSVDSEFSSVREVCEDRSSAREAEKSPLLKAFTRERLMKTQQAVLW
jgi:hypothetical protein